MKRIASKGAALTVLAVLAMCGEAAAFTPVPIPKPRVLTARPVAVAVAVAVAHDQTHAVTRQP
jgi:hypothetical protein